MCGSGCTPSWGYTYLNYHSVGAAYLSSLTTECVFYILKIYLLTLCPFLLSIIFTSGSHCSTVLCICEVLFTYLFLDSMYEWYHTVLAFLYLTYLILHNVHKVHPCCRKWHDILLSHGLMYSIIYMHHIFFIHYLIHGHSGHLHILTIINNAVINMGVCVSPP